jgi:hypothetical protein
MKTWRALRRRILTPDISQTRLAVRGFHVKNEEAKERLETIGRTFLTGYAYAAEARGAADAETELETIPAAFRGFGYEGAAMAMAVRDALPGGGRHVAELLAGRGGRHVYMAYVGVGWAMARLPRPLWGRLHLADPLLRWLALDGYGFHQAYFRTSRYVHQQYREDNFRWPVPGHQPYVSQAIDQGVGRATWFVSGADPRRVVQAFAAFSGDRWADLYAGAGLAATYAGGATAEELEWFRAAAGRHAADLALGSAFAAGARVRADLVQEHNELGTQILCGTSVREAAAVTDETRAALTGGGQEPGYAEWRRRTRSAFMRVRPAADGSQRKAEKA